MILNGVEYFVNGEGVKGSLYEEDRYGLFKRCLKNGLIPIFIPEGAPVSMVDKPESYEDYERIYNKWRDEHNISDRTDPIWVFKKKKEKENKNMQLEL